MKKLFYTILTAMAILMAVPANAQIGLGLKAGVNTSKFDISGETKIGDALKSDSKTGWFIGPMAEFTIPVIGLGVDGALLYNQNEMNAGGSDMTLKMVNIPVNLKYTLGLGSTLGIYLAAGPQFDFNIGHKNIKEYKFKEHETSFNVGGGIKLLRHLQAGLNYNFSTSKSGNLGTIKLKKNTWQFSLAYMF